MIFRAWDESSRFTDVDAGITAADVLDDWAEHAIKTEVTAVLVGWRWSVYTVDPPDEDGEQDEWEVDAGWERTREQAEAAGEKAKADYLLSLTGK